MQPPKLNAVVIRNVYGCRLGLLAGFKGPDSEDWWWDDVKAQGGDWLQGCRRLLDGTYFEGVVMIIRDLRGGIP